MQELEPILSKIERYASQTTSERVAHSYRTIARLAERLESETQEAFVHFALGACRTMTSLQAPEPYLSASLIDLDRLEFLDSTVDLHQYLDAQVLTLMRKALAARRKLAVELEHQETITLERLGSLAVDFGIWIVYIAQQIQRWRQLPPTLSSLPAPLLRETARLTIPLAKWLGIRPLRIQLEQVMLQHIDPERYHMIEAKLQEWQADSVLSEQAIALAKGLASHGIHAEVQVRPRSHASVNQIMLSQPDGIKRPHKLFTFLILVESRQACYEALEAIKMFSQFRSADLSVREPVRDYIQSPGIYGYQGLHISIQQGIDTSIAVRIYTPEMLTVADYGIGANWQGIPVQERTDIKQAPSGQILVFTRGGEPRYLPSNSTALDFAYHIHSELGHHTLEIRVNGMNASLARRLRNGDLVEIIPNKAALPSIRSLHYVNTHLAKSFIRKWLLSNRRLDVTSYGRQLINQHLARIARVLSDEEILSAIQKLEPARNYRTLDDFLARVGVGEQDPGRLVPILAKKLGHPLITIRVDSEKPVLLSQCCRPIPGDPIVGRVTSDRISIHKLDCKELRVSSRLVDCEWAEDQQYMREITLNISGNDRTGLLFELLQPISSRGINIASVNAVSLKNRQAHIAIEATITSQAQLPVLLTELGKVRGVTVNVNQQVGRDSVVSNPYSPGRPIQQQRLFFGREEALASALNKLYSEGTSNALLVWGQKRIGKSSFLYHIQRSAVNADYIPVYNSLQSMSGDDAELMYALTSNISAMLRREGERIPLPAVDEFVKRPRSRFGHFLSEVEAVLGGRRLILMLDEIQVLIEQVQLGRISSSTLSYLRDMVQHQAGVGFIFAYTGPLVRFAAEAAPNQLFDVVNNIKLTYLKPDEAKALVTIPVKDLLQYDPEAVDRLLHMTNHHPWYLQHVCFELFSAKGGRGRITLRDVTDVIDGWCKRGVAPPSTQIAQLETRASKLILVAISERTTEFVEIEEIMAQLEPYVSRAAFERAMIELADLDIVATSDADITISVPLLRQWLSQRMPFRRAVVEYKRLYRDL